MASISFASESLMDPRIQVKLDKYQKCGNIISQTSLLSSYTGSETDADSDSIYTNKRRNTARRPVQLPGRSQVKCQFSLYQCKGMPGTAVPFAIRRQNVFKKSGCELSGGQIVKSQKISIFMMLLLD